ncbi:MAG: glycosyl transferase [Bacteroidetes bacterium]|jgi:uncharacterized protein (TIGR00661 family)|nr:glycosyl transferase [Bacteroidota bacterium]
MKILYALPATGNGHISRAIELYPILLQYGEVDFLVSGCNSHLAFPFPIKYKSKGISLFYNTHGAIDYYRFLQNIQVSKLLTEMRSLPVHKYDCIISDFEPLSAWACKINKKICIQMGHQASFIYNETPRPAKINATAEFIMQRYAPGNHYIGLHFAKYHPNIFPPVIQSSIFNSHPTEKNHITIYLQQYKLVKIVETLKIIQTIDLHIFHPEVKKPYQENNIYLYPIDKKLFNESFIDCRLILTGGGFETPAEALYMQKKMICIPIKSHYEQQCNVAALQQLGIVSLPTLDQHIVPLIHHQLNQKGNKHHPPFFMNTDLFISTLFEMWEKWRYEIPYEDIDFANAEKPYYNNH